MKKILTALLSTSISISLFSSIPVLAQTDSSVLNHEYYASLSNKEVFESYKLFCSEIGTPIAETQYKNGVAYNDFLWTKTYEYNYELIVPNGIECLTYSDSDTINKLRTKTPDYFGFPTDFEWDIDYSFSSLALTLTNCTDIYDLMRLQMTLYNSEFCKDYLDGDGSKLRLMYIDGIFPELKYGDINLNATVEVADAVYILQNIANPSEHAISSLALDVADVVGGNNGIDTEDALAIQKYCCGLSNELPLVVE